MIAAELKPLSYSDLATKRYPNYQRLGWRLMCDQANLARQHGCYHAPSSRLIPAVFRYRLVKANLERRFGPGFYHAA